MAVNRLCGNEEEEGWVWRVRGYRPVVVIAWMTTGQRGSVLCVNKHTHTHTADVIRRRVISSASLLIVQTKMSTTNGGHFIIWVKDEKQADRDGTAKEFHR